MVTAGNLKVKLTVYPPLLCTAMCKHAGLDWPSNRTLLSSVSIARLTSPLPPRHLSSPFPSPSLNSQPYPSPYSHPHSPLPLTSPLPSPLPPNPTPLPIPIPSPPSLTLPPPTITEGQTLLTYYRRMYLLLSVQFQD